MTQYQHVFLVTFLYHRTTHWLSPTMGLHVSLLFKTFYVFVSFNIPIHFVVLKAIALCLIFLFYPSMLNTLHIFLNFLIGTSGSYMSIFCSFWFFSLIFNFMETFQPAYFLPKKKLNIILLSLPILMYFSTILTTIGRNPNWHHHLRIQTPSCLPILRSSSICCNLQQRNQRKVYQTRLSTQSICLLP